MPKEKAAGGEKETAKGDLRRNKLHIPHPVRRLRRTGLVRSVVPPLPTRIASLDSRGSPVPFATPLKTTKEEVIPLPWNHHPSEYRRWRNSIRQIFNGRKRNNSHGILCAWETQSDGPPEGRSLRDALSVNGTQNQNAFSARQRYFVLQRLFSPHSFLARQKRMGRRRHTAPSAHPKHAAGGPQGRILEGFR